MTDRKIELLEILAKGEGTLELVQELTLLELDKMKEIIRELEDNIK